MKWRDIILGAITTLIVTVLSGIAVYYFTREPQINEKESLAFQLQKSEAFEFERNKIAVATVTVFNRGSKPANNVVGKIIFTKGNIKDKQISYSANVNNEFKPISTSSSSYSFSISRFLPNDKVTISFLLDELKDDPQITVRSDESVAKQDVAVLERNDIKVRDRWKDIFLIFLPPFISLFFAVPMSLVLKRKLPRGFIFSSMNNTAFVLMHKGLVEEANKIFYRAIQDGKEGSYAIANYGLSQGLLGKESSAFFESAEFLSRTKHEQALIAFNRTIVSMKNGEYEVAKEQLSKALRLSPRSIKSYAKNSSLLGDYVKNHPEIAELVAL